MSRTGLLSFLVLTSLVGVGCRSPEKYTVRDLGTLGGDQSHALDINLVGEIVGWSHDSSNRRRAFVYRHGEMSGLGTWRGDDESEGQSINSKGWVVGVSGTDTSSSPSNDRAVIWTGDDIEQFDRDSFAWDIEDHGWMVYGIRRESRRGNILAHNADTPPLGIETANLTLGLAINTFEVDEPHVTGRVVEIGGAIETDSELDPRYYRSGDFATFRRPRGSRGFIRGAVRDINNAGLMVGYDSGNERAFFAHRPTRLGGTTIAVQYLAGEGVAFGVNNRSEIVGHRHFGYSEASSRAIVWLSPNASKSHDLNDLIPTDSDWTLRQATAINDSGQIVGYGVRGDDDHERAFLLIPGLYEIADLGPVDSGVSTANSVNNDGVVVGRYLAAGGAFLGVKWAAGSHEDLPTLGGLSSEAMDVNNNGVIVGTSDTESGQQIAHKIDGAGIRMLGVFSDGASSFAQGINDAGRIVGFGDRGDDMRAFIFDEGFHELSLSTLR